jgi:hypothetical protein
VNAPYDFVENGYIAYVTNIKDVVRYAIVDPDTKHLKTIHREPYEESLRIVQKQERNNYD